MKALQVLLFIVLILCNAMIAVELSNTKKSVLILDMRVEGLNRFCATLLECIHDVDRKLAAIDPSLPAPAMPTQHLEYSYPIYKIPGGQK